MLATRITDHVAQALDRLMQQYKGLPNFAALITALVTQIQDFEDAIFDCDEARQLYNGTTYPAVGAQLDGIGQLVNLPRNGLTDDEYLVFILGTIAENFSDTTLAAVTNIALSLFRPSFMLFYEMYPAEISFEVADPLVDPSLYPLVCSILQNSLGAGIGIGFVAVYELDTAFRFGNDAGVISPGTGLGFGNDDGAGHPTGNGGHFAGDIFVNTNA